MIKIIDLIIKFIEWSIILLTRIKAYLITIKLAPMEVREFDIIKIIIILFCIFVLTIIGVFYKKWCDAQKDS